MACGLLVDYETLFFVSLSTYARGLNDQRGSEFIDGVALEEYADEQDDYAQEREIEACIKAVDVDCDGKIGKSVHLQRGVARAEHNGSPPVAQNLKLSFRHAHTSWVQAGAKYLA